MREYVIEARTGIYFHFALLRNTYVALGCIRWMPNVRRRRGPSGYIRRKSHLRFPRFFVLLDLDRSTDDVHVSRLLRCRAAHRPTQQLQHGQTAFRLLFPHRLFR